MGLKMRICVCYLISIIKLWPAYRIHRCHIYLVMNGGACVRVSVCAHAIVNMSSA